MWGCNSAPKQAERTFTPIHSGWEFRQVGTDKWMPATVPGVVHTDLLANKVIENPYFSTNESDLQWIENEEWEYRTTFTPDEEQMKKPLRFLDFKGLDTYAEVYLNEEKILDADNMFVEWRVNVTDKLKEGENSLRIVFKSAYKIGCELSKAYPKLPADNDKGAIKSSVFTRKAQYHFGWDWGPRFVTAGIWKPLYLEAQPAVIIDNVQYIQQSQSPESARFTAVINVQANGPGMVDLILTDEKGETYAKAENLVLQPGINRVSTSFEIKNPQLWWPNGMNKPKPTLYPVTATLGGDGVVYDRKTDRLGVRTVELVREKDERGETFMFRVNGEPLFMKGANIIPQDVFLPNVTPERYRRLVDIAVESNMNMLRVWGGGIYEADEFYDYCDEQGILLWQDFPFACAFYPWDEAFYNSVREEARQNIRRLRNHPSLAIWCGNNEIDEAWHAWGYKENKKDYPWSKEDEANIRKGIDDLFFNEVLPGVLELEDNTRPYHPSSPVYSWGNPMSQVAGDVHYWGVFHGEEPFSAYKDKPGRFSNEYGHQSFANYDTWKKWFKPEDMTYLAPAFHVHQKNPKGYRVIREYMDREVKYDTTNLRQYIYLSQLVQADGIRIAMEGHRQNRPFTMGSLYWQLNDCWPVTSWSSMGYEYEYKALQYFAIKSFAPTILSFNKKEREEVVELWGITDEMEEKKGTYTASLCGFDGNELWSASNSFTIPANSSVKLDGRPYAELLQGADPKKVYMKVDYKVDGKNEQLFFFFLPYKMIEWPEAKFEVTYVQKGKQVEATLTAKTMLKAVLFEAEATQQNPSDGYFDMAPGQTRTITLTFDEEKPLADYGIRVVTLNDSQR
ncbi:glycoside hydrolase family 2 TIM barrel-domain containing protein [Porphyromonadaceae bacterium]